MRRTAFPAARMASLLAAWLIAGSAVAAHAASFDLSPEQPARQRGTVNPAVEQALPAGFRFAEANTLTIGIAPNLPPLSTYATDARTVVGFDPDLAQLIADSIGRKLKIVPLAWADWPLALQSGKVDAVISNVTVTEQRKEKFDFSTYRKDQLGFYVKTNSKLAAIREPKDVAGLRVVTDSGTNQEKILLEWNRQNVARGLAPVEIQYYADAAERWVALQSGRVDTIFSVNSMLAYQASLRGDAKLIGTVSGGWPRTADIAITTRKGSGLAEPLTLAINALIANGSYRKALDHWRLEAEAIDRSQTNPPGLPRT